MTQNERWLEVTDAEGKNWLVNLDHLICVGVRGNGSVLLFRENTTITLPDPIDVVFDWVKNNGH